jgi:hypothetical protein
MFELTAAVTIAAVAAHVLTRRWWGAGAAAAADGSCVTWDALLSWRRAEYWRLPASFLCRHEDGAPSSSQLAHDIVGGAVVFAYTEHAFGDGSAVQWLALLLVRAHVVVSQCISCGCSPCSDSPC